MGNRLIVEVEYSDVPEYDGMKLTIKGLLSHYNHFHGSRILVKCLKNVYISLIETEKLEIYLEKLKYIDILNRNISNLECIDSYCECSTQLYSSNIEHQVYHIVCGHIPKTKIPTTMNKICDLDDVDTILELVLH